MSEQKSPETDAESYDRSFAEFMSWARDRGLDPDKTFYTHQGSGFYDHSLQSMWMIWPLKEKERDQWKAVAENLATSLSAKDCACLTIDQTHYKCGRCQALETYNQLKSTTEQKK